MWPRQWLTFHLFCFTGRPAGGHHSDSDSSTPSTTSHDGKGAGVSIRVWALQDARSQRKGGIRIALLGAGVL